jgi:hypothetical protein
VKYTDSNNKVNIDQVLPQKVKMYAGIGVTGIAGSPATVDIRLRDGNNAETYVEETKHLNRDTNITFSLGPKPFSLSDPGTYREVQFQIRQDTGNDFTVQGNPQKTYLGLRSHD